MLKVALGLNAWAKGYTRNHLDGVGVYSRELYQSLLTWAGEEVDITPYIFGEYESPNFSFAKAIHPSFLKHVLEKRFLGKSLQPFGADIIHAPDNMIPAVKNRVVIATVHDLIPLLHPEWASSHKIIRYIKNALYKKTILSAQHIITISHYSKSDLVNHLDIPEENISVIHLGVNQEFYKMETDEDKQKVLDDYNLKRGFFLFIGTLQPRKNLEACLNAHALLKKEQRLLHPLVIIGNVGWASEELLKKIAKEQNNGCVKWLKFCPDHDVKCLLQSALALVFVSLYEGFGMPILEAFASKCPVITSNVTSIPEVSGEAALMVNPSDKEEIAAAMNSLVESSDESRRLIEKGLYQSRKFSWENCAKQTVEVYKKFK